MRWSCPHCGTQLAIQDEKVSTSWSFSRCYKCAGFALIRKSDTNLIKVDRAPEGEKVVLPEAHEEATGNLSRAASRNLERILNQVSTPSIKKSGPTQSKPSAQPTVRPAPTAAARQVAAAQAQVQAQLRPPSPPTRISPPPAPVPAAGLNAMDPAIAAFTSPPPRFPDPMPAPELAFAASRPPRTLQWAVAATGALAIGSGVYLYIQGQMLWEKARVRSAARSAIVAPALATAAASKPLLTGNPVTTGAAGAFSADPAGASDSAYNKPRLDPEIPKPEIFGHLAYTDQVHAPAMAPTRRESTGAPASLPPSSAPSVPGAMQIQINESTANLRSGPGAEYSIVAMARPNRPYAVTEWKDRWFRIEYDPTGHKSAWIRNDLTRQVAAAPATSSTTEDTSRR